MSDPTNSATVPHDQEHAADERTAVTGGTTYPFPRGERMNTVNEELAAAAIKAVADPAFETRKGFCSRFVREVVASVYGDRYQDLFGPSALATAAFPRVYHSVPK